MLAKTTGESSNESKPVQEQIDQSNRKLLTLEKCRKPHQFYWITK